MTALAAESRAERQALKISICAADILIIVGGDLLLEGLLASFFLKEVRKRVMIVFLFALVCLEFAQVLIPLGHLIAQLTHPLALDEDKAHRPVAQVGNPAQRDLLVHLVPEGLLG